MEVILDPSCLLLPVFNQSSSPSKSNFKSSNLSSSFHFCFGFLSSGPYFCYVLTGLSCESPSHDFLHPTEPPPMVAEMWPHPALLSALSGRSTVYKVGQDSVAVVPPALTLPPSLFPTSQPSTFCALIIPSSWLFPRKTLPRLHTFAPTIFYTLPLKVWTMDQQHQHHPRAYYRIRIHVLTKSPGDSVHVKILEYCLECFFHLLCPSHWFSP